MHDSFQKRFLVIIFFLAAGLSGCGGAERVASQANDPITLVVQGAVDSNCVVTGSGDAVLGSGSASGLTYTPGAEEVAVVTCGEQAAAFPVGEENVVVDAQSTTVAGFLRGTSLGQGSALVLDAMMDVDASTPEGQEVLSSMAAFLQSLDTSDSDTASLVLKSQAASGDTSCGQNGDKVLVCHVPPGNPSNAHTLCVAASAVKAHQAHGDALGSCPGEQDLCQTADDVIAMLISMGQPVVVENVGKGGTIDACDAASVAKYSKNALAEDAASVGMSGCLVYDKLYAVTDLNNPLFTPDNIPASFRSAAREGGTVKELLKSCVIGRSYSMATVYDYLFQALGHGAFSEDDEGILTNEAVALEDLQSDFDAFLKSLAEAKVTDADYFTAFRYHAGYNPSGGWEFNLAAAKQALPVECVDSTPATPCGVDPLRYDFDGATLSENPNGPYVLQMEFRNGGFQDFAYVVNLETEKPYRDVFYQRVKVSIKADDFSAIDSDNVFHVDDLDPMSDGTSSAPFSSSSWRARFPQMTLRDNIHRFPVPEVSVRLAALLRGAADSNRLTGRQAFALTKFLTSFSASIPSATGTVNKILKDHGKTLGEWDGATTRWLAAGAISAQWSATGTLQIDTSGRMTLSGVTCQVTFDGGSVEDCTLSSTLAVRVTGSSVSGGTQYAVTGGKITATSESLNDTFSPTALFVSSNGKSASLTGDADLAFTYSGTNLDKNLGAKVITVGFTFGAHTAQ